MSESNRTSPSPLSREPLGARLRASIVVMAVASACISARPDPPAALEGVVVSSGGRSIRGAVVTITTAEGNLLRNVVTQSGGSYRFSRLAASTYWLSCSLGSRDSGAARPVEVEGGDTRFVACIVETGVMIDGGVTRPTPVAN